MTYMTPALRKGLINWVRQDTQCRKKKQNKSIRFSFIPISYNLAIVLSSKVVGISYSMYYSSISLPWGQIDSSPSSEICRREIGGI